jgi:hypothetical protein
VSASGAQLALEGMALAEAAASEDWQDRWDEAIRLLAGSGREFTADDVREVAGPPTDHPNAAGSRFHTAAMAGLIRRVGYRKSARDVLRAHPIAVWTGTGKALEIPA